MTSCITLLLSPPLNLLAFLFPTLTLPSLFLFPLPTFSLLLLLPLPPSSIPPLPLLQVRWSKECYHHTLASPYLLRLASVNSASLCAVWDVSQACVLAEFTLGQKQVHDIQWLSTSVSHSRMQLAVAYNECASVHIVVGDTSIYL